MKSERMRLLPYQDFILVTDAAGMVLYEAARSSGGNPNVTDREYFAFHRDNDTDTDHVGTPFRSSRTGNDVFTLSRRLEDAQGRFAGVIVAAFNVPFFETLYSPVKASSGGSAALMRNDGIILARGPHVAGLVGSFNKSLYEDIQSGALTGSVRRAGNSDGVRRIISFHKLEKYPVTVAIGVVEDLVMAKWRQYSLVYGIVALALSLSLLWFALNLYAALRRDRQTRAAPPARQGLRQQRGDDAHDGFSRPCQRPAREWRRVSGGGRDFATQDRTAEILYGDPARHYEPRARAGGAGAVACGT
jgi:hypothetical protein